MPVAYFSSLHPLFTLSTNKQSCRLQIDSQPHRPISVHRHHHHRTSYTYTVNMKWDEESYNRRDENGNIISLVSLLSVTHLLTPSLTTTINRRTTNNKTAPAVFQRS